MFTNRNGCTLQNPDDAFCKKFVNIHLNEPEAFHFPYQQMFLVLPSSQVMSLTMTNGCQNVILVDLTI